MRLWRHSCLCPFTHHPPLHLQTHANTRTGTSISHASWWAEQAPCHAMSRTPPTPAPATTCAGTSVSHAPSPPCHCHIGAHPCTPTHPNTYPFTFKLCDTSCVTQPIIQPTPAPATAHVQARLSPMPAGGRSRHQSHATLKRGYVQPFRRGSAAPPLLLQWSSS